MTQTAVAAATPQAPATEELLAVDDLSCTLTTPRGELRIVDGVSFVLRRGETLGIAGESGSGKSMLSRSLMRIAPRSAELTGSVRFDGTELLGLPVERMSRYLGPQMALVFQDPMTALNPVVPIERQITEGPRRHLGLSRGQAKARALELLELVGIPEPRKRLRQYPHELSGGMRQRVMIAIALACDPQLLIADEATTALDVTVQKQILDLLQEIQAERRMAVIMVSHDLGVLAGRTDRTMVMYGGRVMESAPTRELFAHTRHQYTRALLDAIPRMDQPRHTLLRAIPGVPPDPAAELAGCRFAPRCAAAIERCRTAVPPLEAATTGSDHLYACNVPVNRDGRRPA
ncbi:ABC transporter ATP-binding protein [Leucobacter massiliensis]|uniref:Dipeptide/oligopeptide/nickel ABC transporter ATP-binding protein n=1 Tax=Leucobacter massiliensis TaxID=1686285 RepID=A0A2S9QLB9_9MICO|nr:ABC transporter ATP-binding protein [Leucobacter massiliensis]PRI10388.1 dipeptide/oligopeptide/nickel ABC transporter ATP-binding protein [Leucobacter massiliensis]